VGLISVTVKELIEELQKWPEDMEVFTEGQEVEGNELDCEAYRVREPFYKYIVPDKPGRRFYIAQRPCEKTKNARKCLII
jgi:hypothetical protein